MNEPREAKKEPAIAVNDSPKNREQEVNEWTESIVRDVNELNAKGLKIYNDAKAKFADSADVKAFCELYERMPRRKAVGRFREAGTT